MDPTYGYLNDATIKMVGKITQAAASFDASLQWVYLAMGVLMFAIACAKFMYNRDLGAWAEFVGRYVQLMAVIAVSGQWMGMTAAYVNGMGTFAANAAGFNVLDFNPATVAVKGLGIAGDLYTENFSWLRAFFGSSNDNVAHFLLAFGCIGTILLSIFMASWIILFLLAFKLAAAVAMLFLVFMVFGSTRFMGSPGLARMLAYGVQMMVMSLTTGLFFMTLEALDMSGHLRVEQSIALLAIMFAFALLFKWTGNISREQISGMPSLDFHDGARLAGNVAGAVGKMISGIAVPALAYNFGKRMAGQAAGAAGTALTTTGGSSGGRMSTVGSGGYGAPSAAVRMLERPMTEATWTEARDLPKSASRMLEARKVALPEPNKRLPPPPRGLPSPK